VYDRVELSYSDVGMLQFTLFFAQTLFCINFIKLICSGKKKIKHLFLETKMTFDCAYDEWH